MKAQRFIICLLAFFAVVVCRHSAAAPSEYNHPMMFRVDTVTNSDGVNVKPGCHESTVLRAFGKPSAQISDSVWAYYQFRGEDEDCVNHRCEILLVAFVDGRVSKLAIANRQAFKPLQDRIADSPDYLSTLLEQVGYLNAP